MSNARVVAAAGLGIMLGGCPLAMRDDYVVAGNEVGEPEEDAGTVPPVDAGAGTATDVGVVSVDAPPCVPATCQKLGAQCGSLLDGCGGTLECGTCKADKVCGAKMPNHCDKAD